MPVDATPDQRWPMLLLAAVNLECRRDGHEFPQDGEQLARFCREHEDALRKTIASRSTPSNSQRFSSCRMVVSPATGAARPAPSQYSPSARQLPSRKRNV